MLLVDFNYQARNELIKKLRSLKKYCPSTYKYLVFEFQKVLEKKEQKDGIYVANLPTPDAFKLLFGSITIKYQIKDNKKSLIDLEPSQFFIDGYMYEIVTYKNYYCRNEKDKFKIDLILKMKGTE